MAARKADTELLYGIGEYFLATARIGDTDTLRPDSVILTRAGEEVDAIRKRIEASIEWATRIGEYLYEAYPSEVAGRFQGRLEVATASTVRLRDAMKVISEGLKAGQYPMTPGAIEVNEALEQIMRLSTINSHIVQSQGVERQGPQV
jgi:hypothetical protein